MGKWAGVLDWNAGNLVSSWIHYRWITPAGAGNNDSAGWHLKQGDTFLAVDIDGDGRDEIITVSPNGQWVGVLRDQAGRLAVTWIGHDWVTYPSGGGGWNLGQGDKFHAADVDGDGRGELVVVSPNGQWIGILREQAGMLRAEWLAHDWVRQPNGTGGWNLGSGDRFLAADVDGDGRDEIVVVSNSGQYLGILEKRNGGLAATWIAHDWVRLPNGTGGWNLGSGDRFLAADVDGDGRDEIVVVSNSGQYLGILEKQNGGLAATWLAQDWVRLADGTGGWNLRNGDNFVAARIMGGRASILVTSPWVNGPVVRVHFKILTNPTVNIATSVAQMDQVFHTVGVSLEVISTENLNLPALNNLRVGRCRRGNTTNAQDQLFQNRNFVAQDELAIYFVNSTIPPTNGCATHPDDRPGAVVASGATQFTLAHEVGHVLGLNHVKNNDRLMTGNGTANITNPPPDLTNSEGETMKDSSYTIDL